MFNFLNSTLLFAAAAALIPLIIHLFSRRRVKLIEFSSLRRLKEMQRRQLRRLKIRQLLLLLLRMLIILAVVIAFARPTSQLGAVGSHAPVSAVIMVDNSASTDRLQNDGRFFELAKARTMQLLETFSDADRVCLIPLDPTSNVSSSGFVSVPAIEEILQALPMGAGWADWSTLLPHARELLENAPTVNRELYVITDRQRSSLPDEPALADAEFRSFLVEVPIDQSGNLGVQSVDMGGQFIVPGVDFNVSATVHNFGDQLAEDQIASLYLNDQRVAQASFEVPAGEDTKVTFTRAVARTGFHSGRIEISDDNFPLDNSYYFTFQIPERFNVLVIDGDRTGELIRLALVPEQDRTLFWSVKSATPSQLAGVDFSSYEVIVLAGVPQLPQNYNQRLKTYLERGGALFLTYGVGTDMLSYNRDWANVTGVSVSRPLPLSVSQSGFYSLESVDNDHPIFGAFDHRESFLPDARFYAIPQIKVAPEARVIGRFSGDHPALVESRLGPGRVIMYTSSLSPQFTNLTTLGFFVPLVDRIVEYLASDISQFDLNLLTGSSATRNVPATRIVEETVDLIAPDSTAIVLAPEETGGMATIRTGVLRQAGIYRLMDRNRELDRFGVNVDREECRLDAVDPDQLATAFGLTELNELPYDGSLSDSIAEARTGREWWQLFLWIAIALLAVEMLMGRRTSEE